MNIIGAFWNSFAKPNHPNFLWVVYIRIVSRFTFAGYFRLHIYCILNYISVCRAKWLQQVNVAVWLKKNKKTFLTQLFHILDTFHPWASEERFSPRPSTSTCCFRRAKTKEHQYLVKKGLLVFLELSNMVLHEHEHRRIIVSWSSSNTLSLL